MPSPEISRLRAQVARRTQSYPKDHPKLTEPRQALAYAGLTEHAAEVVAAWPKPTAEQLQRIAAILNTAPAPAPGRTAVVAERLAELGGGDAA